MNPVSLPEMLGESEAFLDVKTRISRAAGVNRPVLILGERGTGKELAAARLHYLSPRWRGPYVTLNCAAINQNLAESELFGHETGAFTGANRKSSGRFEAADSGTLFLDEISHLSLELQAKILRVVEYGSFQLVGSSQDRQVDVRLVSASNVDLRQRCREGRFLPDLLDRLSFDVIKLPALKDRAGDIQPLTHRFAAKMSAELSLDDIPEFSLEALEALESYSWPGNVRELKNVVERAVYNSGGALINFSDLALENEEAAFEDRPSNKLPMPPAAQKLTNASELDLSEPWDSERFDSHLALFALSLMDEALSKTHHHQKKAADLLGLTYHRFRFLRQKFQAAVDGVSQNL